MDGAFFLQSMGFGGLVERHDAVDKRFDFSFGEQAIDGLGTGRCSSAVALSMAKPSRRQSLV